MVIMTMDEYSKAVKAGLPTLLHTPECSVNPVAENVKAPEQSEINTQLSHHCPGCGRRSWSRSGRRVGVWLSGYKCVGAEDRRTRPTLMFSEGLVKWGQVCWSHPRCALGSGTGG